MTDLDKMARELLAQWHLDRGLSEKLAQDCRDGVIDIPEIYWELIRAALLTAPPGYVLVPDSASCRHREASTRLGQELELAKRQIQSQQKVIGRLRQDMFLLDELERVWFWQSPTQRARMATAPCWSAGDHSDLRSALAAAFRDTAPEVK